MQNVITVRHRVHHSKDWIQRKRSGHRASRLNAHRRTLPYLVQRKRERDHRLRNMQRKQKGEKRRRTPENKRIYFVMPLIAKHFYGL